MRRIGETIQSATDRATSGFWDWAKREVLKNTKVLAATGAGMLAVAGCHASSTNYTPNGAKAPADIMQGSGPGEVITSIGKFLFERTRDGEQITRVFGSEVTLGTCATGSLGAHINMLEIKAAASTLAKKDLVSVRDVNVFSGGKFCALMAASGVGYHPSSTRRAQVSSGPSGLPQSMLSAIGGYQLCHVTSDEVDCIGPSGNAYPNNDGPELVNNGGCTKKFNEFNSTQGATFNIGPNGIYSATLKYDGYDYSLVCAQTPHGPEVASKLQ